MTRTINWLPPNDPVSLDKICLHLLDSSRWGWPHRWSPAGDIQMETVWYCQTSVLSGFGCLFYFEAGSHWQVWNSPGELEWSGIPRDLPPRIWGLKMCVWLWFGLLSKIQLVLFNLLHDALPRVPFISPSTHLFHVSVGTQIWYPEAQRPYWNAVNKNWLVEPDREGMQG